MRRPDNTRPRGSRCWAHDRCEHCGREVCDDCAIGCPCSDPWPELLGDMAREEGR